MEYFGEFSTYPFRQVVGCGFNRNQLTTASRNCHCSYMGVVVIPIQLMSQINNNDRSRCRCSCMLRSGTASRKSVSTVAVTGAKEVSFRLLAMLSWNYHCMKLNFIANSINQFPLPAKLLQIQESIPVGCQPPACRWYVLHTEQVWKKVLGEVSGHRHATIINIHEHP